MLTKRPVSNIIKGSETNPPPCQSSPTQFDFLQQYRTMKKTARLLGYNSIHAAKLAGHTNSLRTSFENA
jgi:hypothetical protein